MPRGWPHLGTLRTAVRAKMPAALRVRIILACLLPGPGAVHHKAIVKEMGRRRALTVPRDEIEWYPSIDHEKCTCCRACYSFCPRGVFSIAPGGEAVLVTNPYACVVLCTGCVPRCPHGAISFPRRESFYRYVYYV